MDAGSLFMPFERVKGKWKNLTPTGIYSEVPQPLATAGIGSGTIGAGGNDDTFEPIKPSDIPNASKHYTGTIKIVDAAKGTITVTDKAGSDKDFTVGEKAKIATADKKAATLADLKAGDKVRVTYTEKAGKITVIKIAPPEKPKTAKAE
jgi:Cu/Ag efflux protein CusF